MGRDKALLEIGGQTLLRRAVRELASVLERVVIVAPKRRGYERLGVPVVPDNEPGLGPLGGLATALDYAAGGPVFVLACDLPFVDAATVRWLVQSAAAGATASPGGGAQVTAATHNGRVQPLCALYRGSCRTEVERALASGRLSVTRLVEATLECSRLELDPNQPWYHPHLLANLNDPRDLDLWRRRGLVV